MVTLIVEGSGTAELTYQLTKQVISIGASRAGPSVPAGISSSGASSTAATSTGGGSTVSSRRRSTTLIPFLWCQTAAMATSTRKPLTSATRNRPKSFSGVSGR